MIYPQLQCVSFFDCILICYALNVKAPFSAGTTLVAVKDERTCGQLSDYLRLGGRRMMLSLFANDFVKKTYYKSGDQVSGGRSSSGTDSIPLFGNNNKYGRGCGKRFLRGTGARRGKKKNRSSRSSEDANVESAPVPSPAPSLDSFFQHTVNAPQDCDIYLTSKTYEEGEEDKVQYSYEDFEISVLPMSHIVIHPTCGDSHRLLHDLRPTFVVVYDPDPAFIRHLEVRI
jgi:DNA excision repair protein ERCC-4